MPPQLPLKGSNLMFHISAVYVDSDYRRQGLGRRLSFETINATRGEMVEELAARAICMIGVEANNIAALKFYDDLRWYRVAEDRFVAKDGRKIVGIQIRLDIENRDVK
jgi:ribosomal protein S18 acetylase RimI-like enzyme